MKNPGIIRMMRNRYFYGKLLTVTDLRVSRSIFMIKSVSLNRYCTGQEGLWYAGGCCG